MERISLRAGALLAAAAVATTTTVAVTHMHHGGAQRARASGHPAALTMAQLLPEGPAEPGGRVMLWQNRQLLAAEAAASAPPPPAAAVRPQPKPAAAPMPPAPPPPAGSIQQIITQAFSPYGAAAVAWGLRVAQCESGFNPRAYNPAGPYYGLFQFLMSTFRATPYGTGNIYDPVANANAAAWKFANGGASAWGCR